MSEFLSKALNQVVDSEGEINQTINIYFMMNEHSEKDLQKQILKLAEEIKSINRRQNRRQNTSKKERNDPATS